jgi:hypothetical protein
MVISERMKIPLTNRPFIDLPVIVRLDRDDSGYKVVHQTQRIFVKGLPEIRTMSPRDVALYLGYLSAQQPPDEDEDEESPEELIERLKSLRPGGTQ